MVKLDAPSSEFWKASFVSSSTSLVRNHYTR